MTLGTITFLLLIAVILLLGFALLAIIKSTKNKKEGGYNDAIYHENARLSERIEAEASLHSSLKNDHAAILEKLKNAEVELAKSQTEKTHLSRLLAETKTALEEKIASIQQLAAKELELRQENAQYKEKLKAQGTSMLEQQKRFEELQSRFQVQFENLAQKIFEEKSTKFTRLNKEQLQNLLQPVKANLEKFETLIQETYSKENLDRNLLKQEVKKLMELNLQIEKEAKDLTEALKGSSKQQGDWGEMILETILQQSGLEENRQYFKQQVLKNESGETLKRDGRLMKPDIIIQYPDERKLIIDSKVSLNAFLEFSSEDDPELQKNAIKKLLISVRKHIDELSSKKYAEYGSDLDFVMMFIPIEGAYIASLQADPNLWEYAYKKNVVLIGPTNILAALRMISDLWDRDQQTKNAEEIAERGGRLYEKFVGFARSLDEVGSFLDKSKASYERAVSQLKTGRGNLVRQAESLKNLGVKYDKSKAIPGRFSSDRLNETNADEKNLDAFKKE
jgi:DNA recombination protein RmuC